MKLKAPIILFLMLIFLSSCAMTLKESDIEFKYRVTADYLRMEKTLVNVESRIINNCRPQNPTLKDSDCRKAKRYYEVAKHTYIIAGYYYKAIHEPDNSMKYLCF